MQVSQDTILLIDGSSFIFRAFHAIPELNSPTGKPTNATYGVVNMLKQLKKRIPTIHIACIFDAPGKNFRDEIYPEYKATRRETPVALINQFNDIYSIVEALGIPLIMQPCIEADDIIGTIAMHAKKAAKKVLIATGDKDFAQLVDEDITLINTMTNEVLDYAGVINKFDVKPTQIIDYLSLVGDKVDNVPGVEKCGPKTAAKWLKEYGNLETIIANSNKITGVVGENLRNTIPWLATAKKLVTIDTDIDLNILNITNIDSLVYNKPNLQILEKYYQELGFRTWLKEVLEHQEIIKDGTNTSIPSFDLFSNPAISEINAVVSPITTSVEKRIKNNVIIKSRAQLQNTIDNIITKNEQLTVMVIGDTYPTPTNIKHILLSTVQDNYIILHENNTLSSDLFAVSTNTDNQYLTEILRLLQSNTPKLFINYKETLQLFSIASKVSNNNVQINNLVGDITLLHYIKNSKQKHTTSNIYTDVLNLEVIDLPSINTKYTKESVWYGNTDIDTINNHLIQIINYADIVYERLLKNLDLDELNIYQNIELPLAAILVGIENAGIKLDITQFKILENELSARLKILEDQIYQDCKMVFNINSPKQLQEVLFLHLKLPTNGIKKNTNAFSTDEDSLKTLEDQGIIIATYLLEYRALGKLLNTYVNKLPLLVDENGRVHTTFDQALVASGRLSSTNPNLQNIPIKSDWGKRIRHAFIAHNNNKFICVDYSQIELRILAHLSKDENLISAFNNNLDIHTKTACDIFHKNEIDVTRDDRRYAKTINFSLIYGKTVFGLAQELNIDRVTAKSYIDAYFAKYPKIMECLNDLKQFGRENGYVKTVLGRRIYLPNINANNRILREAEERLALNAPMQGTSADIIKIAMCNLNKWLIENKLKTKIILQVHDELILESPLEEVEIVEKNLNSIMSNAVKLSVNLAVDVKIADNWDDAH